MRHGVGKSNGARPIGTEWSTKIVVVVAAVVCFVVRVVGGAAGAGVAGVGVRIFVVLAFVMLVVVSPWLPAAALAALWKVPAVLVMLAMVMMALFYGYGSHTLPAARRSGSHRPNSTTSTDTHRSFSSVHSTGEDKKGNNNKIADRLDRTGGVQPLGIFFTPEIRVKCEVHQNARVRMC